ncbi:MAG TPA: 3-phosphoshikimate 1-carboxyvinyltransferase [Mariniphaga sp.]|nr:3-phosphoshikimate 1-carboxyvinyltransferase [Mariniphaga sp.]
MRYQISGNRRTITGSINLPASKSISNRVLIINALSFNPYPIKNLSDSDDTQVLAKALFSNHSHFNIGHAGTAMRFLTAFLSTIAGTWQVTGSDRMKQRPIGILVEALNKLGAKIEYLENKGYPPLQISGSHLVGTPLTLDGSISSQYISALLLIAPIIEDGLTLQLNGNVTSRSYIELTLKLMARFDIKYSWEGNTIIVPEQNYLPGEFTIEADWSGASYWYQILALAERGEILLENLQLDSLQGDAYIADWFKLFGITSSQKNEGVLIEKTNEVIPDNLQLDFIENPDVAQTIACLCVSLKVPFHFTGLKTLKIKETDRIAALQNELKKFGALIIEPAEGELSWDGRIDSSIVEEVPVIKTYNDHRMAMAFAPMALSGNEIRIDDPMVVTKSYPRFWDDLKKVGFEVGNS